MQLPSTSKVLLGMRVEWMRITSDQRILSRVSALHKRGVVLAFIAEPRSAPAMEWPSRSFFVSLFYQSSGTGTVAVLVLEDIGKEVTVVGDVRAVWVEVSLKS